MTKADWAFAISILSAFTSIAGLLWNVWSKFIYPKARVRVTVGVYETLTPGGGLGNEHIRLSATNHGPGAVDITHVLVREPRIPGFVKRMSGLVKIMVHPPGAPGQSYDVFGCGQLPYTLDVGKQFAANIPIGTGLFKDSSPFRRIGFADGFGRYHWASRKQVRTLRKQLSEFADE